MERADGVTNRIVGLVAGFPVVGFRGNWLSFASGRDRVLSTLPYIIFGLPAGALVDRCNRKRVMILWDAGRALALLLLCLFGKRRFLAPLRRLM